MTTALQQWIAGFQDARDTAARSSAVFLRDVGHGLLEVSHNGLALLGLVIVAIVLFVGGRADLRHAAEGRALDWLRARHDARVEGTALALNDLVEPDAVSRATAADPRDLTKQQAAVALWISRRYRVAPEPVSRLVKEAWSVGAKSGLDPTLILAIMAIESSFNPFAQSSVGAQGLMQVMTRVHDDKYEAFGGNHAAFDPVTNLRVGAQVLKECIARAGGVEAGLRFYVGAANLNDDGGYAGKVLAEREHLRMVADGKSVPVFAPLVVPTPVALPGTPLQAEPAVIEPTPVSMAPQAARQVASLR
ncbi:lytic transglycosylase domain-containing protein [Rhizobacter sp. OV335]|uniref:lytic transglycosylase domain-containing protein n=1 Tax=Rhizobacter sp. OV335 TaxID=1500264 RepID=UPI0009192C4E|nr:lytic transglycosylase domain-containing protein [Rhizobacter sp. OV335]SHM91787.1 Transglycosylase SLT domain-containing protein [Rhizobacter sp. OV335]